MTVKSSNEGGAGMGLGWGGCTAFDFQVITQRGKEKKKNNQEEPDLKMTTNQRAPARTLIDTDALRDDWGTVGNASAASRHGWSLLLVGGLKLSSQVLPAEENPVQKTLQATARATNGGRRRREPDQNFF